MIAPTPGLKAPGLILGWTHLQAEVRLLLVFLWTGSYPLSYALLLHNAADGKVLSSPPVTWAVAEGVVSRIVAERNREGPASALRLLREILEKGGGGSAAVE